MALAYRDRDIRNAMRDLIEATREFDWTTCGGLPEDQAYPGGALKAASIEPLNYIDDDLCEDELGPVLIRTGTAKVTFLAIDEDSTACIEAAERLMNIAANLWNGVSLATLTYPDKTRFTTARWLKPEGNERRVEATFTYQYEVGYFADFGTAE